MEHRPYIIFSIQFCLEPPAPSSSNSVLESCNPYFWLQISAQCIPWLPSCSVALWFPLKSSFGNAVIISSQYVQAISVCFLLSVSILVPHRLLSVSHCCWCCLASVHKQSCIDICWFKLVARLLFSVNVQDWDACSKIAFTLELDILILVPLLMILDFHNLSIALKTVLALPSVASTAFLFDFINRTFCQAVYKQSVITFTFIICFCLCWFLIPLS